VRGHREEDFWRSRYETQHRTVHRLEDEIERLEKEARALWAAIEQADSYIARGLREWPELRESAARFSKEPRENT
jgi:HPt (histidine-containing phosphotransfer) domain-containing protein